MLVNTISWRVSRGQNGPHDSQDRGSLLTIQTRPRVRNFLKVEIARTGFCIAHAADGRSAGRIRGLPGPSCESGLGFNQQIPRKGWRESLCTFLCPPCVFDRAERDFGRFESCAHDGIRKLPARLHVNILVNTISLHFVSGRPPLVSFFPSNGGNPPVAL